MKKAKCSNLETLLDFIIVVSARKLQYLDNLKKVFPKSKNCQKALENTIKNMDNSVFLTSHEIQCKIYQNDGIIEFNGENIKENFKMNFEKLYPQNKNWIDAYTSMGRI